MTCTIVTHCGTRVCGEPAIYTETGAFSGVTFGECEKHAHEPGSMYATRAMKVPASRIGEAITVSRHGCTYTGKIVRVTRGGKIFAEVTYGTGRTATVEV